MAIMIEGLPGDRLKVSGDIAGELRLPREGIDGEFILSFSDGSLVEGSCDAMGAYHFRTLREGAGVVRIAQHGDGLVMVLHWRVDWISIAAADASLVEQRPVDDLPLFPECEPAIDMGRMYRDITAQLYDTLSLVPAH